MTTLSRVAVVGGGIFGVTAASRLARAGHHVELFEQNCDLLMAASGINQYRLHRGYHYPRCLDTATTSRAAEESFRAEYGDAMVEGLDHYYAIASTGSRTDAGAFLSFMERAGLEHEPLRVPDFLNEAKVELCVRVRESLFDPTRLRAIAWERMRMDGVRVHLGRRVSLPDLDSFDFVVVATYARLNAMLEGLAAPTSYQFEVCEKPVVKLSPRLSRVSLVILDGPFLCLDPVGDTGLTVMGNVVHAIHASSVGQHPEIPDELRDQVDRGVIQRPRVTRFARFFEAAREFVPAVAPCEHVGSMFTVRTVLPDVDATDSRPTLVQGIDSRVVSVFSGKIGTCVLAAENVVAWVAAAGTRPAAGARALPLLHPSRAG